MKIRLRSLLIILLLSPAVWAQNHRYTIQVASETSEADAQAIVDELASKGIDAYWVKAEVAGKGTRFRVRIGRFNELQEAKTIAERARSRGLIKEFIIAFYDQAPNDASSAKTATAPPTADPKPNQPESTLKKAVVDLPQVGNKPSRNLATSNTFESVKTLSGKPAQAAEIIEPPNISEPVNNPEPKIATPPVADAIADLSINNSNWKVVRRSAETDKNLRAIHFVDSMTGWAAGDAGAIYRTTDGGRSWKPLLSGTDANINYIYFVNWNNGWMLGEPVNKDLNNEGGNDSSLLFITTNGGRTWTRKSMPNILSLYFLDPNNGWAVGKDATVLKTTNGGEEWVPIEGIEKLIGLPIQSSTYNYGFRDINFIDSEHGWMIGNFYGRARNNIGGLFATADGGKSWKRIPLTLQTQYSSGRFTPGLLHTVRFKDINTGSVTGEMNDGEGRFFFALHTHDGGKTWEQFRTPSRADHSTQFLDTANGWTAAAAQREGGAEAVIYDTTLMRTDNGGMSWQNDFIAKGRRIRSVFFINPSRGWAVGDRGMILFYEEKRDH